MRNFSLFALIILSFHALPVGELQPLVRDRFLERRKRTSCATNNASTNSSEISN